MTDRIILTALDGALLSTAEVGAPDQGSIEVTSGEYERLRPAIAQLQTLAIPVVVFTNRDRAELEPVRQQLGIVDPFIVESGSAVFTPIDHNPFSFNLGEEDLGEEEDDYFVLTLGCPYVQARAGLRVLANMVSHPLKGFGDFTVQQLQRLTGLSETAAHQAKAREFSEPFMTPKAVDPAVLQQTAEEIGFEMVLRSPEENRFSELIGAGAGLDAAVQAVITAYQHQAEPGRSLKVTVISSRSDDFAALTEVKESLDSSDWQEILITRFAPEGWLEAIAPYLNTP